MVKEARIFVKADILRHGIALVDLPGLSDAVESRAQVAERYNQQIDTTIIVTPSVRAIDEKTGFQLMSKYQALRMKLDGKLQNTDLALWLRIWTLSTVMCSAKALQKRETRQA